MQICIMCGSSTEGSMDGPFICGHCDCGIRPDGESFTVDDARNYYIRVREWRQMIQEILPNGDSFDVATMKFYKEKGSIFNAT